MGKEEYRKESKRWEKRNGGKCKRWEKRNGGQCKRWEKRNIGKGVKAWYILKRQ